MYFPSPFFNQFSPNNKTFLAAAEVYPTLIPATARGFSVAVGKLGALTAAVLYSYISTQQNFYGISWFVLIGMLLAALLLPHTTGPDLKEQERRVHYLRLGHLHDCHGIAVHPHHPSMCGRMRGAGKYYDSHLDYQSKSQDMREERTEKINSEEGVGIVGEEYSPEVHEYGV
jgi:hypothetical protein